jgi:beta-galactosidase
MISANGDDLFFLTVKVLDNNNIMVPEAKNNIAFEISGPQKLLQLIMEIPRI